MILQIWQKRKRKVHEKVHSYLLRRVKKDQERNAIYASKSGCATYKGENQKKRKGRGDQPVETNVCVHQVNGCKCGKSHRTNCSQHCKFLGTHRAKICIHILWNYICYLTRILFIIILTKYNQILLCTVYNDIILTPALDIKPTAVDNIRLGRYVNGNWYILNKKMIHF